MAQRKKKSVEYHFVDMNDPGRYKKLKVARACDFCRRRKAKCDIGIPGSGTCSNCKKANHICNFSPVSAVTPASSNTSLKTNSIAKTIPVVHTERVRHLSSNNTIQQQQQLINSSQYSPTLPLLISDKFTSIYQDQYPFFSVDEKAYCGYEKDIIYAHVTLASSTSINNEDNKREVKVYSKEIEQELFDIYFSFVHPFFPVLDRYFILQSFRFDSDSIPCSLKWAVMAISLSHFSNHLQDSSSIGALYYQQAVNHLDHTPCLSTVQTLFLLYKYQEMMTPVGTPISSLTIAYLKEARSMIAQFQQQLKAQQQQWTTIDEFLCRADWILFIIVATSNIADERWRDMLKYCTTPAQSPSLTETEQYDKNDINTTCNLIYLINIAVIYSQVIFYISEQGSLFDNNSRQHLATFEKVAADLEVWRNSLSSQIALSLSANHPSLHSAQVDSFKTASFTAYLCLIHDILQLLIALHQPNQQHDLSNKALAICFRAHSFTVGDMQTPRLSRLASIQGNRLVSFGLTLALQTQAFYDHHFPSQNQSVVDKSKRYYSCCSISYQIFDQISLSPQLYMTIQTFRNQVDSKRQLQLQKHQQQQRPLRQSNLISDHSGRDGGTTNSSSSGSYTPSSMNTMESSASHFYNHHTQQYSAPQHHQKGGSSGGGWQPYSSYNYHNAAATTDYQSPPQDDYYSMPITPTFENENIPEQYDTRSTSPMIAVNSYFQPQRSHESNNYGTAVMVSPGPYFFNDHCSLEICNSKSCKNKTINY